MTESQERWQIVRRKDSMSEDMTKSQKRWQKVRRYMRESQERYQRVSRYDWEWGEMTESQERWQTVSRFDWEWGEMKESQDRWQIVRRDDWRAKSPVCWYKKYLLDLFLSKAQAPLYLFLCPLPRDEAQEAKFVPRPTPLYSRRSLIWLFFISLAPRG